MLYPVFSNEMRHFIRMWRPWRILEHPEEVRASVSLLKDKFKADVDVRDFQPENIKVRVTKDNCVEIEASHELKGKGDDGGYISRQFVRRFVLPEGHDLERVQSKLSSDGVLSIEAPRVVPREEEKGRSVEIERTDKPYWKEE